MENKKKLSHWLLNNYKSLGLSAIEFNWVDEWLPGFHDFQVSLSLGGRTFKGRGIEKDQLLAFTKAGAEALERAVCYENGVSTSGVALHTDRELAKENAKNELIERDRFFCHFLTRSPFRKMSTKEINFHLHSISFEALKSKLNKYSIEIEVFEMNPLGQTKSFICISRGKGFEFLVFGFGTTSSEDFKGLEKAITECLVNTVASLDEKVSSVITGKTLTGKGLYESDLKNSRVLTENQWLFMENRRLAPVESLRSRDFHFHPLPRPSILREAPIYTMQCQNSRLQDSIYGEFNLKKIKLDRLRRFSGQPLQISEINTHLIPLCGL